MSILEHNLDALRDKNPLLHQRLSTIQTNEMFHIHMDGDDPSTLNMINLSDFTPLYSAKASEQTKAQMEEYRQWGQYPYLYMFGMGNGRLIASLLDNPFRKRLVVVEPEIEILWIVLHFIDFSKAIQSEQLVFLSDASLSFAEVVGLFGDTDVKRYARVYDIHVNLPYYERYNERIQVVNQLFVQALHHVITTVGNDVTDTLIGMEHHFMNLDFMVKTPTLYELFKKAKNTNMAVLVSTGPSLNKQLPLLKEIASHVTIVAVDASFPVLSAYGIKPDIVVSMERVALSSTFFKNTPAEFYDGVIFSLSSLQHPELLQSIQGGVIQMSMRPFGFMQACELDQWGYIGIGMSAANMAYELIYHSRFEQCVLIGQDLAYSDRGLSHAQGHVLGSDEVKSKMSDVDVIRYGGEGMIRTSAVWNWFRSFFETDIRETAARMATINATEGGARIAGTIEMPFREVIERFVHKDKYKKPIILGKVKKSDLKIVLRRVEAKKAFIIKTISEAKKEAESLFVQAAQFCDGKDGINENELLQSMMTFYSRVHDKALVQLLFDATQALLFHQEMVIAEVEVRNTSNESEERGKTMELISLYKDWLFALAGCIDAMLVAMQRSGMQSRYAHKSKLSEDNISIDGYFYDYKNEQKDFELELLIDGEPVISKRLHNNIPKGNFIFSIPFSYFNDQVHWISVREKNTGIILVGMPENRLLLNADKNKAQFMESLDENYDQKITNFNLLKSISFLAIEGNLNDRDLIDYFNDILNKIQDFSLHIFYFNEIDKEKAVEIFDPYKSRIESFRIESVNSIVEKSNIIVLTHSSQMNYRIFNFLRLTTNLVTLHFNSSTKMMTIDSAREVHKARHPLLVDPYYFGFSEKQLQESKYSVHKVLYSKFFEEINDNQNLYEFAYIKLVENILRDATLREYVVNYLRLEHLYNCMRN